MPDLVPAWARIIAGGMEFGLLIALGIALAAALAFVGVTARRAGERRRRLGLGLTSVVAGPLVGAIIAWSDVARGRVTGRLQVGEAFEKCIGMGVLVGVLVGLAFLITAAFAPGDAPKPPADPEL